MELEKFRKRIFSSYTFLLVMWLASACGATGELTVQDAWARPAAAGDNSAVYLVIQNDTTSADALISVSTDVASTAEAHMSMLNDQGVVSMQMQEAVQIPAGDSLKFKPGGLHIMLVDLQQDLKVGDTFTLVLKFERAGEITMQIEVRDQ